MSVFKGDTSYITLLDIFILLGIMGGVTAFMFFVWEAFI